MKKMKTKFTVNGSSVVIRYPDGKVRAYRDVGGYIYDITDRPGTLGRQVLDPRPQKPCGTTLMSQTNRELTDLLRVCLRCLRTWHTRHDYAMSEDVKL
jgi:hypothetical protein